MGIPSAILLGLLFLLSAVSSEDQETKIEQNLNIPNVDVDRSSHRHVEDPTYQGFWKKKFIWRPRWAKTWQEKRVYVAVWKRMWAAAEFNEWVPVPKPPPGWVKHKAGSI